MRFPTAERLLPELVLPPAERERLRLKARGLVDDAITQYETFVRVRRRRLSRKHWKVVKRREGLTVYKERGHARGRESDDTAGANDDNDGNASPVAGPDVLHTPSTVRSTLPSPYLQQLQLQRETSLAARGASGAATPRVNSGEPDDDEDERQRDWKLPGLLMVGSIVGTLEDVMYGGNPAAVSKLLHPRDLVFLEATGIETRWNGERYGYHLMHSEEIEDCGPLSRKCGVVRARLEMCVVYRQMPNGSVDVFMKALVDSNGSAGESVALFSAANGLSYCWRAVVCAQNKKLAWQLAQKQEKLRADAELAAAMTGSLLFVAPAAASRRVKGKNACCAVCRKSAHAFRHLVTCELCTEPMCSRCKVSKKLSYTTWRPKEVASRDVLLCKRCVSRSAGADAFRIAREEVLTGKWDQEESDISIMPMPSRTSSSASSNYYYSQEDGVERKPPRASAGDSGFDRTLRLSLAQMELKENEESGYSILGDGSQSAPSFPIRGQLWGNSFDSTPGVVGHSDEVDEEDQEYFFDEQGRASEVPRPSYASSVSRHSSFVDVSSLVSEYSRASTYAEPSESVVLEVPTPTAAAAPPVVLYTAATTAVPRATTADEKLRSRSVSSPPELSRGPIRSLSDTGSLLSQSRPSAPDLLVAPVPSPAHPGEQQDLLKQMMMLRDAAEHVYLYTRHNSVVHTRQAPQVWPGAR
ncbi:hypothetical protein PybrP1_004918 [[Pythium] brassicae (nom. inval.)]|nr:hypothetical protein PybrP1_004918 [[Pythium] brassicae (nom. inval.)]